MRLRRAPVASGVETSQSAGFSSACKRVVRLRASCAPISDLESYPYRIGTVHMCRDAAYADAGVLSGAFSSVPALVNFTGVALDV